MATTSSPGVPADHAAQPASAPLVPGTPAPDFTLHAGPDKTVALSGLRGRPVILAFYPADWSPVCGDQMVLYNEVLDVFGGYGAQLLGVSVDSVWCHKAFAEARHLRFPLLADFEPKGAVARSFDAYRAHDGFCERALFVLDAGGVVRWSYTSPVSENPGADGILAALDRLTPEQRGGAAPLQDQHATTRQDRPSDTLAAHTTPEMHDEATRL